MKNLQVKLYNTATRQKEVIFPLNKKYITMYTCGPTIYDFAHIGNFRTYIFEDLLKRSLKFLGFKVVQVMNITDVDDKTINGATEKRVTLQEYTEPYKKAFFEDIETLNIEKADHYPLATDYINDMITIILDLVDKRYAYTGMDGSIYFSIEKFKSYGKLSHLDLKKLKVGGSERVLTDEYDKENVADFVLWKRYDPMRDGEIYWDSPFGKGRPGWHIECSAMALKLLGFTIDIHCGGVDNIFPHHENEIAQSESYTNSPFVRHWLHSEHLIVDGRKMSKSLGNFYTLRDLLERGCTGREIRYLLLETHYRMRHNFTFEGLDASKASLERFSDFIFRMRSMGGEEDFKKVDGMIDDTLEKFSLSLADDLNISQALAALFDFIREINTLCDRQEVGRKDGERVLEFLRKIDGVLGVLPLEEELDIPKEIKEALKQREAARREENWHLADELREVINLRGYVIEDTPTGAKLKKK